MSVSERVTALAELLERIGRPSAVAAVMRAVRAGDRWPVFTLASGEAPTHEDRQLLASATWPELEAASRLLIDVMTAEVEALEAILRERREGDDRA